MREGGRERRGEGEEEGGREEGRERRRRGREGELNEEVYGCIISPYIYI